MTMSPQQAHAEALRRIREARETRAIALKLYGPITHLPEELSELGEFLLSVDLSYCNDLTHVGPLRSLTSLALLNLRECCSLKDVEPLRNMASLVSLNLQECLRLHDIDPLRGLSRLNTLNLTSCRGLTNIEPLRSLANLKAMEIFDCKNLANLEPLRDLAGLASLGMGGAGLTDLEPLRGLASLTSLAVCQCPGLTCLEPLRDLAGLTSLVLGECGRLTDLEPLRGLVKLVTLYIPQCGGLTSLEPLAGLPALASLNVWGSDELVRVDAVRELPALVSLSLGLRNLRDLEPLRGLSSLTELFLECCDSLTNLEPLRGLSSLATLHLAFCQALTDLEPLRDLGKLTELDMSYCVGLTSLEPLRGLVGIATLYLTDCKGLTSVEPLRGLVNLSRLLLDKCVGLTSVESLRGLIRLTTLSLYECEGLTSLEPLSGMVELTYLDLNRCGGLHDLEPLRGMVGLKSLDLHSRDNLTNLEPLRGLVALTDLNLMGCAGITDLGPLRGLAALAKLNLCGCRGMSSLEPLRGLVALNTVDLSKCNGLTSLEPLRGCVGLAKLNLSGCKGLTSVEPLGGLAALTELDLSGCVGLTSVAPLWGLTSLVKLDLLDCVGLTNAEELRLLLQLPCLDSVYLHGCTGLGLDPALLGSESFSDVLSLIRAHFADLDAGAAADAEVKLFILGNAGVGKTQTRNRLCGHDFQDQHASTHGIQIDRFEVGVPLKPSRDREGAVGFDMNVNNSQGNNPSLTVGARLEGDARQQTVRVNLWDFGGQDIYHGTHALFLDPHAVFLILWTPQSEAGEFEENGIVMRHRPLSYWLDYVRGVAGNTAPIVVVRNKCDEPGGDAEPRPDMPTDFAFCEQSAFSAKNPGAGLLELRGKIRQAIAHLHRGRAFHAIGVGRVAARDHLRRMLEEDQARPPEERRHRTLSMEEYEAICRQAGAGKIFDPLAMLDFLHKTGVVSHHRDHFAGRIILDQTWALDAIYTVFQRSIAQRLKAMGGRFTSAQLGALAWPDKSEADRRALVGMMMDCGVCFPARMLETSTGSRLAEWEYAAPDFLPDVDDAADPMPAAPPDAWATATFDFLHEGVLRALLVRVSRTVQHTPDAAYWRYGCHFHDERTTSQALVESTLAEAGGGGVSIKAWGPEAAKLAARALDLLLTIPMGRKPVVTRGP